jgi:hypothetical protein
VNVIYELMHKQVLSKKRVTDHGEVYTRKREVNAMLDLVKQETERIDSRFLEPACGTGNFLVEVLERKMRVVQARYRRSQLEYERNAVKAVSSIYGIELQEDNVEACRNRLFYIVDEQYSSLFQKKAKKEYQQVIKYILSKNIIHGNALTLKTNSDNSQPIVFSEWAFVRGSMVKRRDFIFHELYPKDTCRELSLFDSPNERLVSDLGSDAFIPEPIKEYPLTHYMRIPNADI